MRYLTMLGLMMLLLGLCSMPSSAQSIPPGSYQQTCTDINLVNGSTLAARCQDRNGEWRSTRLTNVQDCNSEIINDNGSLRCNRGGNNNGYYGGGYNYGQGGLPPGDYVQTCRNIRTYGNRLEAECQKRNGDWRRTSLDNIDQCRRIVNIDGHLSCGGSGYGYGRGDGDNDEDDQGGYYRRRWQGGIPPGDYAQTCRNISTDGNRLNAECQKRNGKWRRTSLDNIDECSSPIANDNGRLVCGRGGYNDGGYGYGGYNGGWRGGVPSGTYTQTCRNIRMNGNRLEAECQARNGDWRRTSLDDVDRCTSAPANDDGHLMCGR